MSRKPFISQKESDYHKKRSNFSSDKEFLVTTLGFAAGYGSIWRFPYLVFKYGGGAFLVPYLILLFVLAIPIFYLEIGLGQMHKVGLPQLLERVKPQFKGVGYFGICICANMATYYNLLMAYSIYFLIESFQYPLPWEKYVQEGQVWSGDFFYKEVLNLSESITELGQLQWGLFFCYIVSLLLSYLCIRGGVELTGRIAIYTASAPYILLIILFLRGIFLPGAGSGIYYLFVPDFQKIMDIQVWVKAANQVIFQMSVGIGVLILYGSYREKKEDITRAAIGIPLLTMACGLIGGLVVFSYIGYICHLSNIPIDQIPIMGPELTFVFYPATISNMPFSNIWAILFFIIMVLLGIDTQFGFMECISGTLEDANFGEIIIFGHKLDSLQIRFAVCIVLCFFGFLYCNQAGFYFLDVVDIFTTTLPFMGFLLFEIYFFCMQGDQFNNLETELAANNHTMPLLFKFFLCKVDIYLVCGLSVISIYSQILYSFEQPFIIFLFGWFISLYPFYVAYYYYKSHQNEQVQPIADYNELTIMGQ